MYAKDNPLAKRREMRAAMDAPANRYARTSDGYDIAYMVSGEGRPLVRMPAVQNQIVHYWHSNAKRPGSEVFD